MLCHFFICFFLNSPPKWTKSIQFKHILSFEMVGLSKQTVTTDIYGRLIRSSLWTIMLLLVNFNMQLTSLHHHHHLFSVLVSSNLSLSSRFNSVNVLHVQAPVVTTNWGTKVTVIKLLARFDDRHKDMLLTLLPSYSTDGHAVAFTFWEC